MPTPGIRPELYGAEKWPHWRISRDGDPVGYGLYRRHYSAKNPRPKVRLFVGPGQKLVLVDWTETAVFAWRKFIDDSGQRGVCCSLFRNEGTARSSALVREACAIASLRWPGDRRYTLVDPARVTSANPGYCFLKAGWRRCGATAGGLLVLEDANDGY